MYYKLILIFTIIFIECNVQCLAAKPGNNDVILNDMIDQTMPDIRKAVKKFGFDPMRVPNISHTVYVEILWVNHSVAINLTNGIMRGISKMKRSGNFYLSFRQAATRIHSHVHFDELKGRFNFSYNTLVYSDSGYMDVTIKNVTATLAMDYRIDRFELLNPALKIINTGDIRVSMHSDATLGWATNIIANVAIPSFKEEILKISQKTAAILTRKTIHYANRNIIKWISDALARVIINSWNFVVNNKG